MLHSICVNQSRYILYLCRLDRLSYVRGVLSIENEVIWQDMRFKWSTKKTVAYVLLGFMQSQHWLISYFVRLSTPLFLPSFLSSFLRPFINCTLFCSSFVSRYIPDRQQHSAQPIRSTNGSKVSFRLRLSYLVCSTPILKMASMEYTWIECHQCILTSSIIFPLSCAHRGTTCFSK